MWLQQYHPGKFGNSVQSFEHHKSLAETLKRYDLLTWLIDWSGENVDFLSPSFDTHQAVDVMHAICSVLQVNFGEVLTPSWMHVSMKDWNCEPAHQRQQQQ